MAMKEALKRPAIEDEFKLSAGGFCVRDEKGKTVAFYIGREEDTREIFEKADVILKKSKVLQLLGELAEMIRPDLPDVKLSATSLEPKGLVHRALEWDFRDYLYAWKRINDRKGIEIRVNPVSERIIINGYRFTRKEWANTGTVEDAIATAYRFPVTRRSIQPERNWLKKLNII